MRFLKLFPILLTMFFADLSWAACTVSTNPINFGTYDVFQPLPTDSDGMASVICTTFTLIARVDIGPSPNSGGFNPRRMKLLTGPDFLDYNLFRDNGRTSIWGDGTGGSSSQFLLFLIANNPRILTVYGGIPPGQDISVGQYSDVLTVTVNF
jgi:spore coat protein U-like protein